MADFAILIMPGGLQPTGPHGPGSADVRLDPRQPGTRVIMEIGYTMMCEQSGPRELVRDVQAAEDAGFDFSVVSDHIFPWLDAQGHSPYAWSVLGAAAQATTRLPLMTFVTCPIRRYHPVLVAQKAATVQILSEGRFSLGLGAGENLNEHVVGGGWPSVDVRHGMLREAVEIIRSLFKGGYVGYQGRHFEFDSAKLWDLPETVCPVGIAVSGPSSAQLAGDLADLMIAVEPEAELGQQFDAAGGSGKPRYGQLAVSFDEDSETAVHRAWEQFRWFSGGWKINAELPGTAAFAAASQSVRHEDVAEKIPCGPDIERHLSGIRRFAEAGFTHLALVQIGGDHQLPFIEWAANELLPPARKV